jgi:hypothetical protein
MKILLDLLFVIFFVLPAASNVTAHRRNGEECAQTILYLPLDERYTTYRAFLNLAETTPYCILSPPEEMLPSWKTSADLDALHQWIDENIAQVNAMIISSEMYLYGGLIASRISNDSTNVVATRAERLFSYATKYPSLDIYVSNVVMRIPAYDGDFEEPWYWASYGQDLYTYSYYLDKYNQQNCTEDYETAQAAINGVPSNAVNEFQWRRARNHNITMMTLSQMSKTAPFHYFYTTLDDNAEFGFNIREAAEIKNYIGQAENKLNDITCPVYPGADEVHLVMLARFAVSQVYGNGNDQRVALEAVYRDPTNVQAIPSYEGQPMIDTLTQQIQAAGGILTDATKNDKGSTDDTGAYLFVNNFSGAYQTESVYQPTSGNDQEYAMFDAFIDSALSQAKSVKIMGFCDNRYANGADRFFVAYMNNQMGSSQLKWNTYAGWNTNGNTVGTVVANTILLHLFRSSEENARFNSLRLLEDNHYQADQRQVLSNYVYSITNTGETASNLTPDLDFYERFAFKVLSSKYQEIASQYQLQWKLGSVYYPWNRTFEIGFSLN